MSTMKTTQSKICQCISSRAFVFRRVLHSLVVPKATLAVGFVLVAAAAPLALANEPILKRAPLREFVERSKPQWNFARANNHDSCWPAEAIYADGKLNPGAAPKIWPNSNSNCPAVGQPFPTYYSAKECITNNEIRVSYTLYIPNSYFVGGGHRHDFEGVVVVWKKRDGEKWTRDRLLMSSHGKYVSQSWDKAESWNANWSSAGLGREFPRVFVGWGSHAMFNDQNTRFVDIVSQATGNEYRSAKYPVRDYSLVEVTEDNELGKKFFAKDTEKHFGSADTHPAKVARDICKLPEKKNR